VKAVVFQGPFKLAVENEETGPDTSRWARTGAARPSTRGCPGRISTCSTRWSRWSGPVTGYRMNPSEPDRYGRKINSIIRGSLVVTRLP
jgi:hypothetical protein